MSPSGNRDIGEIFLVIFFGPGLSVPDQAEDRVLLRFRPQSFPANIGSNATQNVRSHHAQAEDTNYNGNENADDGEKLLGDGQASKDVLSYWHTKADPGMNRVQFKA